MWFNLARPQLTKQAASEIIRQKQKALPPGMSPAPDQ